MNTNMPSYFKTKYIGLLYTLARSRNRVLGRWAWWRILEDTPRQPSDGRFEKRTIKYW